MCCKGLHGVANAACLSRFLFCALHCLAPYFAPGGVRLVLIQAQICSTIRLARGKHPKYVQHIAGHAHFQLILDHYCHWTLSIGGALPTGWTKHWARRPTLVLSFPSMVAQVHAATARREQAAAAVSLLPRLLRGCSTHPGLSLCTP